MLHRIRRAGIDTETFGYSSALEKFESIVARLRQRIAVLSGKGSYVVVGHSLGGVLLRAALSSLPAGVSPPQHAYLLGSPLKESRLAKLLNRNIFFRAFAGDCGQLLGSPARMAAIAPLSIPTTGIAGVRGIQGRHGPFGMEANDGIVSVSEVIAPWLTNQVQIPVVHTLLPSSGLVAGIVLQSLPGCGLTGRSS